MSDDIDERLIFTSQGDDIRYATQYLDDFFSSDRGMTTDRIETFKQEVLQEVERNNFLPSQIKRLVLLKHAQQTTVKRRGSLKKSSIKKRKTKRNRRRTKRNRRTRKTRRRTRRRTKRTKRKRRTIKMNQKGGYDLEILVFPIGTGIELQLLKKYYDSGGKLHDGTPLKFAKTATATRYSSVGNEKAPFVNKFLNIKNAKINVVNLGIDNNISFPMGWRKDGINNYGKSEWTGEVKSKKKGKKNISLYSSEVLGMLNKDIMEYNPGLLIFGSRGFITLCKYLEETSRHDIPIICLNAGLLRIDGIQIHSESRMLFVIAGNEEIFTDVKDDEQIFEKWKNSVKNNTELTVSFFYINENEEHNLDNGYLDKDMNNLVYTFLKLSKLNGNSLDDFVFDGVTFEGGGSLYSLSFDPSSGDYYKIIYDNSGILEVYKFSNGNWFTEKE